MKTMKTTGPTKRTGERPRSTIEVEDTGAVSTRSSRRVGDIWIVPAAWAAGAVLLLGEVWDWSRRNRGIDEHLVPIDKDRFGDKMSINLNITFPALHCDDVNVDVMNAAGKQRNDVVDNLVKTRLRPNGSKIVPVEEEKEEEGKTPSVQGVVDLTRAEAWLRPPKKGEGCNLAGQLDVGSRAPGNFHIAMGNSRTTNEGKHLHYFKPEELKNFNASHVIHNLSFGPEYCSLGRWGDTTLDGKEKITTAENGFTGIIQYFIKVVPARFRGNELVREAIGQNLPLPQIVDNDGYIVETNHYFFTETYQPLIKSEGEQSSIFPGVFFMYDLYPVAVEFTKARAPISGLILWMVLTVCGVVTVTGWARRRHWRFKRRRRRKRRAAEGRHHISELNHCGERESSAFVSGEAL